MATKEHNPAAPLDPINRITAARQVLGTAALLSCIDMRMEDLDRQMSQAEAIARAGERYVAGDAQPVEQSLFSSIYSIMDRAQSINALRDDIAELGKRIGKEEERSLSN